MPPKTIRELGGSINIPLIQKQKPILPIIINVPEIKHTNILSNIPNLTENQISQIDKIINGYNNDPDYDEAIITIFNTINEFGFDKTIKFLNEIPGEDILRTIIFDSPINLKLKENYLIELDILRAKEEVEEGIYQCGKCGGKKTISRRKQVRSADEPETNFITCLNCKNQWREG